MFERLHNGRTGEAAAEAKYNSPDSKIVLPTPTPVIAWLCDTPEQDMKSEYNCDRLVCIG